MIRANVENVDAIVAQLRPALEADMASVRASLRLQSSAGRASALCQAEKNVLRLVGLGLTNAQIADHLCVSMDTVRTHSKRLHDKCGVRGRARLAVLAAGAGA